MTHTIARWSLLLLLAGMIGLEFYQINRYEECLATKVCTINND